MVPFLSWNRQGHHKKTTSAAESSIQENVSDETNKQASKQHCYGVFSLLIYSMLLQGVGAGEAIWHPVCVRVYVEYGCGVTTCW